MLNGINFKILSAIKLLNNLITVKNVPTLPTKNYNTVNKLTIAKKSNKMEKQIGYCHMHTF